MKGITRDEILKLLPNCSVPDLVRDKFVIAGIITATKQDNEQSDQQINYQFNMSTFAGVPDLALSVLYHELKSFFYWYTERERCIDGDDQNYEHQTIEDKYNQYRLTLLSKQFTANTKDELEQVALRFARIFINQWQRYQ